MTRCFVVDTYAWIEYFDGNKAYRNLILRNELKTPAMAVAELSRIFARRKVSQAETFMLMSFVSSQSAILPLGFEEASRGGSVCHKEKLAFADGVIYSYASAEEPLLTGDEHFRGKKNVQFVK